MKIRKTQITSNPLGGRDGGKTMYELSEVEFGGTRLISEEELQQLYEFRRHELDCDYVREEYSQFTEREFAETDVDRIALAMRNWTIEKGVPDYEALEEAVNMYEQHCEMGFTEKISSNGESKSGYTVVVIQELNGKYHAEINLEGKIVSVLSEAVDYRTLKKKVNELCGIELPLLKKLKFQKKGCRYYANFSEEEPE